MNMEKTLYCHWDLVRFVEEKHLKQEDGTFLTLSVTDGDKLEYMIFLGKDDATSEYEVRVYKCKPDDEYVQHEGDDVKHFEENDEYIAFFFDNYDQAHHFVEWLPYWHSEYYVRPGRLIDNDNKSEV